MILFYRQFFLLHSKKSILQVEIQRLRNNCRHVRFLKPFLRWKFKKKLKQVQDERWGLEFLHIQAQYSGESCCKMVWAIGRPHWGCMGSACLWANCTTQSCTCLFWGVFGRAMPQKLHYTAIWAVTGTNSEYLRPACLWRAPTKLPRPIFL